VNFRLLSCSAGLLTVLAGLVLVLNWHHDPGWARAAAWWCLLAGYLGTAFCEPWKIRLRKG
jgi:uncharacterized membrane protein YdcZ (DUF606 family)